MAEEKKSESEEPESQEFEKEAAIEGYEKLIDRLKEERKQVRKEMDREYKRARGYVRAHPEEGVVIAFAGGLVLGLLLGKLSK